MSTRTPRYLTILLLLFIALLSITACDAETLEDKDGNAPQEVVSEAEETNEEENTDAPQEAVSDAEETSEESPADEMGTFTEDECPFETTADEGIRCGYLEVQEDRTDEESAMIALAVAIIPSLSDNPQADPILYLSGGPGDSALADPDSWLESSLRDEREIILLDQRGTGFSEPNLNCVELERQEEDQSTAEAAEACQKRLEEDGINLAAYNSAASAADVHELRLALGYEEWNLLGISYGTRLALTVMRDFPTGIRSVVLDSVYPPNVDAYTDQPLTNANAIQALLRGCAADSACNEAFPNIEERFYELVAELNESPVELEEDIFSGDNLIDLMVSKLYDTQSIPKLPYAIDEGYYGNFEPLFDLEAGEEGEAEYQRESPHQDEGDEEEEDFTDSEGQFYSVECHEEVPFGDIDQAEEQVADYPPELTDKLMADLEDLYAVCDIWQAGEAPQRESEAVVSDIPTLLLAGEYDPVTPPTWARLAAERLSSHYLFEIPAGGHSLTDAGDCPLGIIQAFLARPNQAPDGSCVDGMKVEFFVE